MVRMRLMLGLPCAITLRRAARWNGDADHRRTGQWADLGAPSGTRPTSDRVREALFSALTADRAGGRRRAGPVRRVRRTRAGGALAGAASALFVESDRRAAGVLRRNVAALGLPGATVRAASAAAVLGGPADRAYDVVLVDPPYATPDGEVAGWLADAYAHGWLAADAVVVVERGRGPGRCAACGRRRWSPHAQAHPARRPAMVWVRAGRPGA